MEPTAAVEPIIVFGALSGLAGCLALWELYNDCKFQQAARKGLQGASYAQVGMPVSAKPGGTSGDKKEMV